MPRRGTGVASQADAIVEHGCDTEEIRGSTPVDHLERMRSSPHVTRGLQRAGFTGGWLDGHDRRTSAGFG
jgi:hypothetical protein